MDVETILYLGACAVIFVGCSIFSGRKKRKNVELSVPFAAGLGPVDIDTAITKQLDPHWNRSESCCVAYANALTKAADQSAVVAPMIAAEAAWKEFSEEMKVAKQVLSAELEIMATHYASRIVYPHPLLESYDQIIERRVSEFIDRRTKVATKLRAEMQGKLQTAETLWQSGPPATRDNRSDPPVSEEQKGREMKAVAKAAEPAGREQRFDHIRPLYLEALTLVERLHRRLLDVIKDEFDRRGRADINSVQALLLYNIGDKELTAGELRTRGYYLGSSVDSNLKKLVAAGFLDHQRSRVDRRSVRIKLTQKGHDVRDIVESLYQKHVRTVEQVAGISVDEFSTLNKSLHRLERFWTDQILYRL